HHEAIAVGPFVGVDVGAADADMLHAQHNLTSGRTSRLPGIIQVESEAGLSLAQGEHVSFSPDGASSARVVPDHDMRTRRSIAHQHAARGGSTVARSPL